MKRLLCIMNAGPVSRTEETLMKMTGFTAGILHCAAVFRINLGDSMGPQQIAAASRSEVMPLGISVSVRIVGRVTHLRSLAIIF